MSEVLYPELEQNVFAGWDSNFDEVDVVSADFARNLFSALQSAKLDAQGKTLALDQAVTELQAVKRELDVVRAERDEVYEAMPSPPMARTKAAVKVLWDHQVGLATQRLKWIEELQAEISLLKQQIEAKGGAAV